MSRYIPFPAYYDDMPIDISFVFRSEKPAGKHGFLKADGSHFTFEDGSPARFWGVNFNGAACFPEFDYSEKVAKRLAKAGVNLVRFHQLDSEWHCTHIFAFNKGKRIGSTMELHPESMKRLDYLVKCLKDEGIYCYLDMNTYRNMKSGDGIENAFEIQDAADPYCYYNRRMIEIQKKFIYDIWNHINPYTGLAYKDDPVFVLTEIINERDFFSRKRLQVEPYVSEFRELFRAWCKENGKDVDVDAIEDLNDDTIPELVEYKIEVQINFFREMYDYMREVGVKVPICGSNWKSKGYTLTKSHQIVNDFMDMHNYFSGNDWKEGVRRCTSKSLSKAPNFLNLGKVRALNRPLFVSEWDMPWPNDFRAESSILYAAIGCLQGWDGWAIHTYSYGTNLDKMKILGKEASSMTIGNVPYREGLFTTWNDPAKFGLFYHAALITRRGDVKESPVSYAMHINDLLDPDLAPTIDGMTEYARVGVCFDGIESGKADHVVEQGAEPVVDCSADDITSVTGELFRSRAKGYGTIDTDRTKVAYGFLGKNGEVAVKGMSVKAETDFAVVALSSLTDADISASDNMLLSTVGRAKNTNMWFEDGQMYDFGEPPILVEVIEAEISIKTERRDLIVWAVNAEGYFVGKVPAVYEDGCLKFTTGKTMPSAYYLIQAE